MRQKQPAHARWAGFALAVPLAAFAQTPAGSDAVQVYGRIDASVNHLRFAAAGTRPAGTGNYVSSDASRIGFTGSERLAGGLRAYFKIEHGFNVDTGSASSPSAFFNRESLVGLSHPSFGALQFGSQYTPDVWLTARIDPFARSGLGSVLPLFQQGGPAGARGYPSQYANAVQYISPRWHGLLLRVLAASDEGAAPRGHPSSLSVEYAAGPLLVGAIHDRTHSAGSAVGRPGIASVRNEATSIGASYDLRVIKLHAYLLDNRVEGAPGLRVGLVGARLPLGSGELHASWQRRDARDAANSDARLVAVQYIHPLSKRTAVYAGAAHVSNQGNATFIPWPVRTDAAASGLPGPGGDVRGFQLGVRHSF